MGVSIQTRYIVSNSATRSALIDRPSFIVFAIISLMQPGSLSFIGLSVIDDILTTASLFILIYTISFFVKKHKIPAIICWVICYHVILTLYTLLDSSPNYEEIIKTAGPAVALCLLVWICVKRNIERYLKSAGFALGVLLTINIVSMVVSPGGLYTTTGVTQDINYFLGFDNTFVLWTVPFVFHIAALSIVKHGRLTLWTIPCFFLAFATEAMTWAVTGMFTVGLEIVLIVAVSVLKPRISFRGYFVFSIIAFICVILLRVQSQFPDFFELYLGKDASFTGRSELWDSAIDGFLHNPVFGKGISNDYLYGTITQPHCFYLEVLYRGGAPLLFFVILMFKELTKASKQGKNELLVTVAIACVGAWLICMTTDSILHKSYFWAMMVACIAFSELSDGREGKKPQWRDEHALSI